MSARDQLKTWFLTRGLKAKHLRWEHTDGKEFQRAVFSTTKNNYFVAFKDDYLGMTVSSRVARPGETWLRGNDLHDGKFSKETFGQMMDEVLTYELREVSDEAPLPPWTLQEDAVVVGQPTASGLRRGSGAGIRLGSDADADQLPPAVPEV